MSLMRIGVPFFGGGQHDLFDVADRLDIAAAANHVLGAAKLDEPPAGFFVTAAHSVHDPRDRDAIGLETIGIDVDLVLAAKATERRDLRDSGHGLEVVAEIPVLVRA